MILFEVGETYHARLMGHQKPCNIRVMYILEGYYESEQLIVFRWHETGVDNWVEDLLVDNVLNDRVEEAIRYYIENQK